MASYWVFSVSRSLSSMKVGEAKAAQASFAKPY
jgi:hypothetical protein